MSTPTLAPKTSSLEDVIKATLGSAGPLVLEDLEPEIQPLEMDPDGLKVFMGTCHCSLMAPM